MVKVYQGGEEMRYEKPELEIIKFHVKDVITASTGQNGTGDDWDVNSSENY